MAKKEKPPVTTLDYELDGATAPTGEKVKPFTQDGGQGTTPEKTLQRQLTPEQHKQRDAELELRRYEIESKLNGGVEGAANNKNRDQHNHSKRMADRFVPDEIKCSLHLHLSYSTTLE